jgi:hypothetical protein
MAGKSNYIPRNDAEFDQWFKNLIQYLVQKTNIWKHIPKEDMDAFGLSYTPWVTAYTPTIKPHSQPETAEKNRAKKTAERQIREFVNRFLRYRPVSDADRDIMGIPNRDLIRTPHTDPKEEVEFVLRIKGIRQVHVDFKVLGSTSKAKPDYYDGAVIVWDLWDRLSGQAPARPEDLYRHVLASKTPHTLKFDETERGKTVYVALCWQNRGQLGPWSEMESTIVP